ncbi:MAG: hypothetical protein ACI3VN_10315 [Candidatus Onthomonas sp.]
MESSGYCEVLVKVKASKTERTVQRVLWILTYVFLGLSVLFLFMGMFHLLFWPLTLVFFIAAMVWRRKLNIEYEYQYLDGSLRIDKIIAMKKRKKCGRYEIDNLYAMAPEGDEHLAGYQNRDGVKQTDYSSHDKEAPNRYQLVFQNELVIFEPSEDMVRQIWRTAPSKVTRKKAIAG